MKNNDISICLEKLNEENIRIMNSLEYRIGLKICKLKKMKFLNFLKSELTHKKISKYNSKLKIPKDNFLYGDYNKKNKKIVIYTCITGGYDQLQDPMYYDDMIDYVAFSDRKLNSSIWRVIPIPEKLNALDNNVLINRYIKFKPFEFFKEYDYSIYIDGNILVISDLKSMINKINDKTGLAFHRHNCRNCTYQEAKVLKIQKKGNIDKIDKLMKKIKHEGFPEQFGLYEANIITVDLKNDNAVKIMNMWYDEFKKSECFRDQIILPYVVWKNGYEFNDVGNLGINMHNNPKLRKVTHNVK